LMSMRTRFCRKFGETMAAPANKFTNRCNGKRCVARAITPVASSVL
jgi:hypothetical protein